MATPIISGSAALIKQAHPDWSSQEFKLAIKNTARKVKSIGEDEGWGIVDIKQAASVTSPIITEIKKVDFISKDKINIWGNVLSKEDITYTLYYRYKGSSLYDENEDYTIYKDSEYVPICQSKNKIDNSLLCEWKITGLADGFYELKLQAKSETQESNTNKLIYFVSLSFGIEYPHDGSILPTWEDIVIKGSVSIDNFDHYTLDLCTDKSGFECIPETITVPNEGRKPIFKGNLGTINTKKITKAGIYYIQLKTYSIQNELKRKTVVISIDPSIHNGWPKYRFLTNEPVLHDINKDGKKEMIFINKDEVFVTNEEGKSLKGWPVKLNREVYQSLNNKINIPSVGDLDHNGRDEIVFMNWPFNINIINDDGTFVLRDKLVSDLKGSQATPHVLADIDGDGFIEIIVVESFGRIIGGRIIGAQIHILDRKGNEVKSWFLNTPRPIFQVAVADIDGDGKKEIILKDFYNVYVFN